MSEEGPRVGRLVREARELRPHQRCHRLEGPTGSRFDLERPGLAELARIEAEGDAVGETAPLCAARPTSEPITDSGPSDATPSSPKGTGHA